MSRAPGPAVPAVDDLLCFAIHSAGFAFNKVYQKPLKALGLTYPQFLVMAALWESSPTTVGALATKLAIETSTLTPLLKRLAEKDLLTRRRSEQDERRVIVSLSGKGAALRSDARDVLRCVNAATGLGPERLARLRDDVLALRSNLAQAAEA